MAFFKMFKSAFQKADFISPPPNLKIEGKESYKTAFGGFINILLTILSIVGTIYFGKKLFVKTDPVVVRSEMEGHQVGPFEVNNSGFNIFVAVEYPNMTYYVNERVFTFNATYEVNKFLDDGSQEYTITPIDYDLCSKYYSKDEIDSGIDYYNFFCVKPDTVTINGYWGAEIMTYLKIRLYKCFNTTENNDHCLPEEEIVDYLQGGYLSMYTTNSFLDFNNETSPVTLKLSDWFNSINIDLTYDYVYNIKSLLFQDDHGFLLENIQESEFPYYASPSILYYGDRGGLLCTVIVQGYKYGERISRSYLKIQDVLTNIGGLLKAFSVIATFIITLSSNFEFYGDSLHNFKTQLNSYAKVRETKDLSFIIQKSNIGKDNLGYMRNNFVSVEESDESSISNSKNIFTSSNNNFKAHLTKVGLKKQNNNNSNDKCNDCKDFMYKNKEDSEISKNCPSIKLEQSDNKNNIIHPQLNHIKSLNALNKEINSQGKNKNTTGFYTTKDLTNAMKSKETSNNLDNRISSYDNLEGKKDILKLCKKESGIIIPTLTLNLNNPSNKASATSFKTNKTDNKPNKTNKEQELDETTKNLRLLESTLDTYSNIQACSDYFTQLLNYFKCKGKKNSVLLQQKEIYDNKIKKLLSINYIFKKFFYLELLENMFIDYEQKQLYNEAYLSQLYISDNPITFDDSSAFEFKLE